MMYTEGFFQPMLYNRPESVGSRPKTHHLEDVIARSDTAENRMNRLNAEPMLRHHEPALGVIFSREGLLVAFDKGWPIRMETPWGEWYCWEGMTRRIRHWTNRSEENNFMAQVGIDQANFFRGTEISTYPITEMSGKKLPPHEQCGQEDITADEANMRAAEWITLCEAMTPKRYPHWFKYIEADLPLPPEHPDLYAAKEKIAFYRKYHDYGPRKAYFDKHFPA